jgi:hypothetical protein
VDVAVFQGDLTHTEVAVHLALGRRLLTTTPGTCRPRLTDSHGPLFLVVVKPFFSGHCTICYFDFFFPRSKTMVLAVLRVLGLWSQKNQMLTDVIFLV